MKINELLTFAYSSLKKSVQQEMKIYLTSLFPNRFPWYGTVPSIRSHSAFPTCRGLMRAPSTVLTQYLFPRNLSGIQTIHQGSNLTNQSISRWYNTSIRTLINQSTDQSINQSIARLHDENRSSDPSDDSNQLINESNKRMASTEQ